MGNGDAVDLADTHCGPEAFSEAWGQWLQYAWHGISRHIPLQNIVCLSQRTGEDLYGAHVPRTRYARGARPLLERQLNELAVAIPCLERTRRRDRFAETMALAEWVHWEVYRRGQALRCGKWSQQLIEGGTEEEVLGFLGRTDSFACSRLLVRLLQVRGIPARLGFLFGTAYRSRVGVEACIDGAWCFFDIKANVHYLTESGAVASLRDLLSDRTCFRRVRGQANPALDARARRNVKEVGIAAFPMQPDPRGYSCKTARLTRREKHDTVPDRVRAKYEARTKLQGKPVRTKAQLAPYLGWGKLHGHARPINKFNANEPKMSEAVVVCAETANYLYARFTPTTVRYVPGSRPVLEALLRDCVLRGRPRPASDLDLAFLIHDWIFSEVLVRYLVLWDVWHARQMRYFGNEEDSASFRNRSDCYCTSRLLASMLQTVGMPARLVYMQDIDTTGGHTAVEAHIDGKWRFLDVSCHDYALNRDGEVASFWEILSDPYCRTEGLREDRRKVTAILRLPYLANAMIANFSIKESTAHYRKLHGSYWFEPDGEDARRACRFGF